ncbi:MAG: hypothetical protein GY754_03365 [bacterium]|nr:hypothetical protein [bacterium]
MAQAQKYYHPNKPGSKYKNGKTVDLDEDERETLEIILKEILVNLPHDPDAPDAPEEVYRSDMQNPGHFKLHLYGYEMRAIRRVLGKVR